MKLYFYITSSVLIIFYWLIITRKRRRKRLLDKLDYSAEGANIVYGISKCKGLHKELIKLIHPDRIQEDKKSEANQLIQEVNAARYDYRKLVDLKADVLKFINE